MRLIRELLRRRSNASSFVASSAALLLVVACQTHDTVAGPQAVAAESAVVAKSPLRALSGSYTVDTITVDTRYWDPVSGLPNTATAAAVFNALPTNQPGYTNGPWLMPDLAGRVSDIYTDIMWADTTWAGRTNPAGMHTNLATRYHVALTARTSSVLSVEFGVDFRGGALYVDGVAVAEDWNDPWWRGSFRYDSNPYTGCTDYVAPPCLPIWVPNTGVLGATVTLAPGRHVIEVVGFENGNDSGNAARIDNGSGYQFMVGAAQPAQRLTVTAASGGTVTSSPAGISCPGTCSANFPLGTTVTLTASANANFGFGGWTGDCMVQTTCVVPMYKTSSVSAAFVGLPSVTGMTMESRYWNGAAFTHTGAGALSFFNALPTNVVGYTNVAVPVTALVNNQGLFTAPNVGANNQLATRAIVQMSLPSAADLQLRYDADAGGGGVMLIDGVEAASYWGDGWGTMFTTTARLTQGAHTITVLTFEDCCDGGTPKLMYNVGLGWVTATAPPLPTIPLTVSVTAGTGAVTSTPAGINCGTQCQANYATGSQVTLTATPAQYFRFDGWGGSCTGTGSCVVRMLAPSRSVTTTFTRVAWPVTITTGGTGTGSVTTSPAGTSCGTNCVTFAPGTTVTFTATPGAGSVFSGWSGLTGCTSATCTVTVNSALTVSATFNDPRVDNTPPVISCKADPAVLWPVNHKLVDVEVKVTLTDAGSGPNGFKLVSITANEPVNSVGDGNTLADWAGWTLDTPDVKGQFRAERQGTERDRIYTLTYRGFDKNGNSAVTTCAVTVPHDQRDK